MEEILLVFFPADMLIEHLHGVGMPITQRAKVIVIDCRFSIGANKGLSRPNMCRIVGGDVDHFDSVFVRGQMGFVLALVIGEKVAWRTCEEHGRAEGFVALFLDGIFGGFVKIDIRAGSRSGFRTEVEHFG